MGAASGTPTGGREGASAQGTNQVVFCVAVWLPPGAMVIVVTVFTYVTLHASGAGGGGDGTACNTKSRTGYQSCPPHV